MTLRRKLQLLLFSVASATALIVGLFSFTTVTSQMEQQELQSLEAIAASRATAVSIAAQGWKQQIMLVKSRTRLRQELAMFNQQPLERHKRVIQRIVVDAGQSTSGVIYISVIALDGTTVAVYGEQLSEQISEDLLIKSAVSAKLTDDPRLYALRPAKDGRIRAEHQVMISYEGAVIGRMNVAMNANELVRIATDHTGIGQTGEILIAKRAVNNDAIFVAPTRNKPEAAFKERIPAAEASIPSTQAVEGAEVKDFHRYRDYQGKPIIAATRYLPELDGGLVAKMDRAEASEDIHEVQGLIAIVIVVVLLVSMIVATRLAGGIVKPIEELGQVVEQVRDGDFTTQASVNRSDEIGHLAENINDMTTALGRSSLLLRDSEERFRRAFEDSAIGMAMVSIAGQWMRVNHALCQMLGYSAEELLERDFQSITHPDDLGDDLELVDQLLKGQIEKYTLNKRYFHKDGQVIYVRLNVSLVRDVDEAPLHFVSQIEDITEEEETKRALDDSLIQLQRSNQELEDFAYTASHDLKEPLRTISNFSMFLEEDYRDKVDADGLKMMKLMRNAAARLEGLIDELLKYSRAGRAELKLEPVDLNTVVTEIRQDFKISLQEKKAQFNVPQLLPELVCDRIRITQILQNLLSNAIKYNESETPFVEIGFREQNPIVITVRDNGIGIPPEHQDKVFRIFKRLHAREEYGGGHGAGLTIVKKLVELHGGKIWVEPADGQGSLFCFTLGKSTQYK